MVNAGILSQLSRVVLADDVLVLGLDVCALIMTLFALTLFSLTALLLDGCR